MMTNDRDSMARDGEALARVRVLLQNYPRLSQTESDEVAHFLKKGAPIDIGLLASDRSIWETAQVFKAANPHYFKLSYKVYAAWVVAITVIVGSLALLKDFAVERTTAFIRRMGGICHSPGETKPVRKRMSLDGKHSILVAGD